MKTKIQAKTKTASLRSMFCAENKLIVGNKVLALG